MGDTAIRTDPDDGSSHRTREDRTREAQPPGAVHGRIHLSQREVEQVISRAVELQQEREVGRGTGLTLADLQDVVAQVGVDADLVRRALDDVRLGTAGPDQRGLVDRVLGPRRVTGAAAIAGDPHEVSRAIATWMTDDEGMVLAGTRDGADRWLPDKRLLTQVRHGLQVTRSESALRGLRSVTTRAEPAADGTLVAVEADTSSIRTANTAVLSASGLVGVIAGAVTATVLPESATIANDVAQFAAGLAGPVAAGAGIVAIVHRSWLGRVRRAVVQALDGISMTSRDGADATPVPPLDWTTVKRRWLGG